MPYLIKTITDFKVLRTVDDNNERQIDIVVELHYISKGDISSYFFDDGTLDLETVRKKVSNNLSNSGDIEI